MRVNLFPDDTGFRCILLSHALDGSRRETRKRLCITTGNAHKKRFCNNLRSSSKPLEEMLLCSRGEEHGADLPAFSPHREFAPLQVDGIGVERGEFRNA